MKIYSLFEYYKQIRAIKHDNQQKKIFFFFCALIFYAAFRKQKIFIKLEIYNPENTFHCLNLVFVHI